MNSVLDNFNPKNNRSEPRRILRTPATLLFKDRPPVRVRTIDISTSGIAIMVPMNVAEGQSCGISVDTFVNGRMVQINAVAKVIYSICVGTTGFRVGMQFTNVEPAGQTALAQLME